LIWAALSALACGDIVRARSWADDAAAVTKGMFHCLALSARVRVCIAEGDTAQAAADVYEGLAMTTMGAYLCVPDYLECLAALTPDGDSSRHEARLLGAASAMRQRFELPRFKIYDGDHEALVTRLRNTLGDDVFESAWAEGAALSTDEAIAYAQRGRGERKRPSTGWDSLTPTEVDVVRLVAEGIPNKDIATRLFVSPRTVQSHLRHVYNKLGLTSRVQLAQEASRQMTAPQ